MSAEHVFLIFRLEGLSGSEKLLLLAYANHTDAHGYCYPSVERLVDETGTSKMTVIRTRKSLEEKKILKHQKRVGKTGIRTSNLYRLDIKRLRSMERVEKVYDDNAMAIDFVDEEPPKMAPEQPKYQNDTGGSHFDTPGYQNETDVGSQIDTLISQSLNQSLSRAREEEEREIDSPEEKNPTRAAAAEIVSQIPKDDARRISLSGPHVSTLIGRVAEALEAGFTRDLVGERLKGAIKNAASLTYLLNAVSPERLKKPLGSPPAAEKLPSLPKPFKRESERPVAKPEARREAMELVRAVTKAPPPRQSWSERRALAGKGTDVSDG